MPPPNQNPGQVYAERALQPDDGTHGTISIPRVREARDLVYSGTMPPPAAAGVEAPAARPRNRRGARRAISPFNMILILLAVAVVSVLYISNVLAVGRLLIQNNTLEVKHRQLINDQEILRAQISRLESLERVEKVATEQLGLKPPTQPPVWLEVDPERVQEVQNALDQQQSKR